MEAVQTAVLRFSDLQVGERFYFATRPIEGQRDYTKVEEMRRPYTPESHSNAKFSWRNVDPRTETVISEGETFFYVTPTTEVLRRGD